MKNSIGLAVKICPLWTSNMGLPHKKKKYPGPVGLPSEFSKTYEETAQFLRETFKGGYK